MDYITITKENLKTEHICCAISSDKDCQVMSKKNWLAERLDEGLVFLKADARGKCFIEYMPAEKAWFPIEAPSFMHIDCFWVSGQFKGHGYSNELLDRCIEDSKKKGKVGLTVVSSVKKESFLSDPGYLAHRGFLVADTASPFYTLMYLPFSDMKEKPHFLPQVKEPLNVEKEGFVIYYSNQCPFTAKYVPILEETAASNNIKLKTYKIDSLEKAKAAPTPSTSFVLFKDGKFLSNAIPSVPKFLAMAKVL